MLKIVLALMVVGIHTGFLTEVSAVAAYVTVNGLFRIAPTPLTALTIIAATALAALLIRLDRKLGFIL